MSYQIIVIGASAGGLEAFTTILNFISKKFPLPIVIVQHMMDQSDGYLPLHLSRSCNIHALEVEDKQKLEPGCIYTSPSGYHILAENKNTLALSTDVRVNYSRPSIDLLFESAARVFRSGVVGILLTGANDDGANGLKKIHDNGGFCIVQDPKTASASYMPESAIRATQVDLVLSLEDIGKWLQQLEVDHET